jgi:hypothetical protein
MREKSEIKSLVGVASTVGFVYYCSLANIEKGRDVVFLNHTLAIHQRRGGGSHVVNICMLGSVGCDVYYFQMGAPIHMHTRAKLHKWPGMIRVILPLAWNSAGMSVPIKPLTSVFLIGLAPPLDLVNSVISCSHRTMIGALRCCIVPCDTAFPHVSRMLQQSKRMLNLRFPP